MINAKQKVTHPVLSDEIVMQQIYLIRGQKVMLDRDLAALYGYETKRMNEQVRRNQERFPASFMFQLTAEEVRHLRSQIATANVAVKSRTLPYAFTEHGVLMLASILKSDIAIKASVHIIEVFVKMREMILTHKDILVKLEQLEKNQSAQDMSIRQLYQYIKVLMTEEQSPRAPIGFKVK